MVSGVRSSCAALAVNRRWVVNPWSSRSSARFTAMTSGSASVGTSASGSRSDIDPGPMALAWADAARKGSKLLRTLYVASSKASAMNGGTYQAISKTNSRRMEWTS